MNSLVHSGQEPSVPADQSSDVSGQPNKHGVYRPAESLTLPNPKHPGRGMPLAEIDLIQIDAGWLSAIGIALSNAGYTEPLTARTPHLTREAAVTAAVERIRHWLASSGEAMAPVVSRWLDTLLPDQLDLFGAAA